MERFVGRYEHSLDSKGRLVLPARLRTAFEGKGGYLAKGQEGCLALWPADRYEQRLELLEAQADASGARPDRLKERVFSAAEAVTPDSQGRIPVAQYLQDWARLDPARVLVNGANRIVELWNVARWEELESLADQDLLGDQAEAS